MKDIVFLIKVMNGGGAEKVVTLLSNHFISHGYDVTVILTHQSQKNAQCQELSPNINIISLEDADIKKHPIRTRLGITSSKKLERLFARKTNKRYNQVIKRYKARNLDKILYLKKFFKQKNNCIVIAFLYDSMFYALLSKNKKNKVIISERADPVQNLSNITDAAFVKKLFEKSDEMVFQSPDAMRWYLENTKAKGRVIFNPIDPNLPDRYEGERKKRIVNFCRISSQKNLHLLVNAFELFSNEIPDYELYIYGDATGNGVEGYLDSVKEAIEHLDCKNKIHILPAQLNIHNLIRDYTMFVSSSNFEGMSNSMLESMAIGLPTICTDCPAGGARAIIEDHKNGILVPVNDVIAMKNAMIELAKDFNLAERLSINGTKLRDTLSVDKIVDQWMEIIND